LVSVDELSKHSTAEDIWIVVDNDVWDISDFAPEHPGGFESMDRYCKFTAHILIPEVKVILKYAGRDATQAYSAVHAPSLIADNLGPERFQGLLDRSTADEAFTKPPVTATKEIVEGEKPPLDTLISTHDFEVVASKTLALKTWAFYSSAATDLITKQMNAESFDKVMLRPRMLRNVSYVTTETTILGCKAGVPFFVCPAAMAKLVHPEGEKAIARGCKQNNVIQTISTQASYPLKEIVSDLGVSADQSFFFQLYVNKDRRKSEELLAEVKALGIKAIFVTIDAPVPGKREADERVKADEGLSVPSDSKARSDGKGGGYGRIMGRWVDASLSWDDVAWLKRHWDGPMVLKGLMTAADAQLAVKHGLQGIVLSNHGGRNLDTSPASILILLELHKCCPEVFDKIDVLIDGGIRRGTDIFKALCLGAKAVGIGRGFLYALNYGEEGIEKFVGSKFSFSLRRHSCVSGVSSC
jgi:L-lactate dehydrogenase (cytochrome)